MATLSNILPPVNIASASGTLAVANGGTNAATAAAALANLGAYPATNPSNYTSAGPITGNGITMSSDKLLGRNTAGTGAIEEIAHATLAEMQAGTQTALRGLSPANVGQAITALATANAILPSQAGNGGKYLATDGASVSWQLVSSSSSDLSGLFF